MKPSTFDPTRLEVAAFTQAGATREGVLPLAGMNRLAGSSQAPADGLAGDVTWSVRGLWKQPAGGAAEMRIHLVAHATVHLSCQRCLQPMAQDLDVDRTIRFVPGEDQAAQLDEELEEDVLALARTLDLAELIEDELILALPIVPMHEACPQPLPSAAEVDADLTDAGEAPLHPFGALAALKKGA
jgi:uncharacterized protein